MTTGQLIGGQLVVGAASLLVNVLSARTMGPSGRGGLALLLQVAYLTNMICMTGIDRSYPASVPHQPSPRSGTTDVLRLVLPPALVGVVAVVPVVTVVGGPDGDALSTAAGFALTVGALIGGLTVRTGATASGAGGIHLLATAIGQLSLVAVATLLAFAGVRSADLWLLGYGAGLSAGPLAAWLLLRRAERSPAVPPDRLRAARRLGLRLLPATAASMVMLRADRLLLPWLGSYEQLGLYIVVATVTEFAIWPVQSYVDAHVPQWHQRFLAGSLCRRGPLTVAAGYGAAVAVALPVAGHLLIEPVFGAAYRESVALMAPLALGVACYAVSRVAVGLSVATGQARAVLAADLPAVVVALAAYGVLIPRYGATGAAVGSAVAYGVGALLAVLLCLRAAPPPGRPDLDAALLRSVPGAGADR